MDTTYYHFYSHFIGQNLITWLCWPAREVEKIKSYSITKRRRTQVWWIVASLWHSLPFGHQISLHFSLVPRIHMLLPKEGNPISHLVTTSISKSSIFQGCSKLAIRSRWASRWDGLLTRKEDDKSSTAVFPPTSNEEARIE